MLCSPSSRTGYAIHVYAASASMEDCCLGNSDGNMLIVPQQGDGPDS
jgi:homogentisate 1,2-dioxygenase